MLTYYDIRNTAARKATIDFVTVHLAGSTCAHRKRRSLVISKIFRKAPPLFVSERLGFFLFPWLVTTDDFSGMMSLPQGSLLPPNLPSSLPPHARTRLSGRAFVPRGEERKRCHYPWVGRHGEEGDRGMRRLGPALGDRGVCVCVCGAAAGLHRGTWSPRGERRLRLLSRQVWHRSGAACAACCLFYRRFKPWWKEVTSSTWVSPLRSINIMFLFGTNRLKWSL